MQLPESSFSLHVAAVCSLDKQHGTISRHTVCRLRACQAGPSTRLSDLPTCSMAAPLLLSCRNACCLGRSCHIACLQSTPDPAVRGRGCGVVQQIHLGSAGKTTISWFLKYTCIAETIVRCKQACFVLNKCTFQGDLLRTCSRQPVCQTPLKI